MIQTLVALLLALAIPYSTESKESSESGGAKLAFCTFKKKKREIDSGLDT